MLELPVRFNVHAQLNAAQTNKPAPQRRRGDLDAECKAIGVGVACGTAVCNCVHLNVAYLVR